MSDTFIGYCHEYLNTVNNHCLKVCRDKQTVSYLHSFVHLLYMKHCTSMQYLNHLSFQNPLDQSINLHIFFSLTPMLSLSSSQHGTF